MTILSMSFRHTILDILWQTFDPVYDQFQPLAKKPQLSKIKRVQNATHAHLYAAAFENIIFKPLSNEQLNWDYFYIHSLCGTKILPSYQQTDAYLRGSPCVRAKRSSAVLSSNCSPQYCFQSTSRCHNMPCFIHAP